MNDFDLWTILSKIICQKRSSNLEIIPDLHQLCQIYPQKLSLFEFNQMQNEESGIVITLLFFEDSKLKIITVESWNNTFRDISINGKEYDRILKSFDRRLNVI